ncbi:hypothetical protein ACFQ3L_00545 [Lacticaseibacillus jixianensis]|uniref:Helicase Helix-turn-helix domain-containing protein n=1 Tax=Lacticaseibacillus jixianensis TaxID=2486012 RepID=A0ABW4B7S2_9LACO|nr:hypothetical protein [Lacticaseibacillus jixianensis]
MLTDFVVQLFDDQPRRETAVYMLLNGKKTLSVLFAALQHGQLQWLQLYPTLAREDFQAAVAQLIQAGALRQADKGLVLADPAAQARAAVKVPLPVHYQPWMGLAGFEQRFLLAVQAVSEASYHEARYRPAVRDWGVQQAIRRWYRQAARADFPGELTAAFAALPAPAADRLASRLIGHDFVGSAQPLDLAGQLQKLDDLAQLVTLIAAHPEWPALTSLWGGRVQLLSPSNYRACQLIEQGQTRAQVASQLRLKASTVNEHLLAATIFGWQPPVAALYSPALLAAFAGVNGQEQDYQKLLAALPGAEFFHVRLFQILNLQGRWPHA